MNARQPGRCTRAGDGAYNNNGTTGFSARSPREQQPVERHEPLPDDKVVWFHVVTPRMIARLAEHFRRGPVVERRP